MTQHSEIGERILAATEIDGVDQPALVIRHHHEHYDGHGYPDHLCGEGIPLLSRIISIADSYDAMAMMRGYRRAVAHREIMKTLDQEAGSKHDPAIMRIFCTMIDTSDFKAPDFRPS